MASIHPPTDVERAFRDADEALAKNDMRTLDRIAPVFFKIQSLTTEQRQKMTLYFRTLSEFHERKNSAQHPSPQVVTTRPETERKPCDHRVVAVPETMDIGKRILRERNAARVAQENRAKNADSPCESPSRVKSGLEVRAEQREERELSLIKTLHISPDELLPQSFDSSGTKGKGVLAACKKLIAADPSDTDAILRCIPDLARACLKYSRQISIPKGILFAFCIRRDLPENVRKVVSDYLSSLLETDDRDLADADTDEMIEPDDADLQEVEEVKIDENFDDLLEEGPL